MIERFNFFDVYGYLIPGGVALSLFWLPFAVAVTPKLPESVTSAFVAALLAYVVGHLLQAIARQLFLPKKKVDDKYQYPSSWLLDDKKFVIAKDVADAIRKRFRIDVVLEPNRRNDALLLCRSRLIAAGHAAYTEQQEGMYELMRGVSVVMGTAFFFTAGWIAGASFPSPSMRHAALIAGGLAMIFAIVWKRSTKVAEKLGERIVFAALLMIFTAAVGFASGGGHSSYRWLLGAVALTELFAAFRTYGAFLYFSSQFAKTIYRDFLRLENEQPSVRPGWLA